jgi:pimeloyl-ACP methyl ester carboxylesterase
VKRTIYLSLPLVLLISSAPFARSPDPVQAKAEVTHEMIGGREVRIDVLAQGSGPVIVILPSLGRGAEDYDAVAAQLAADGFRVLRPQPRGIGRSTGPMSNLSLHDYAADVALVIEHEHTGSVTVVGHAFGNAVARMLATDRPDLVQGLVLAAASPGKVPSGVNGPVFAPEVAEAIGKSGDLSLTDDERLRYLALAFFAPGHDPRVWLGGWYPDAMKDQNSAFASTPVDLYFAGGRAPILDLQAEYDAVAPRKFSGVLKAALGSRVTVEVIPNAGHALVPEQPNATATSIAAFARKLGPR